MDWYCKTFDELTTDELYEILRLRTDVFIVEQNCPYPDIDGRDRECIHLFARQDDRICAYLRMFRKDDEPGVLGMCRVVTAVRGVGLGAELLRRGIRTAFDGLGAGEIYIEAQDQARGFYTREGFVPCSDVFPEDGIPHVQMRLRRADRNGELP